VNVRPVAAYTGGLKGQVRGLAFTSCNAAEFT